MVRLNIALIYVAAVTTNFSGGVLILMVLAILFMGIIITKSSVVSRLAVLYVVAYKY